MYSKVCVLLLALGLSQAMPQIQMPNVGLMQFMMNRDLSQDNPSRSLECFGYYLPLLNQAAEQYQEDFKQCLAVAQDSRDSIDDTTEGNRTEIDKSATDACQALTECSTEKGSIEYFSCYEKAGSENTKTMYTISANSAEILAQVRELYRVIEVDQYVCTNKSDRVYVESSSRIYDDLDLCIKGAPLPSETTSTQAPTTAEPTTAEPTTAEPTTAEPTTAEPTTAEPTTAEPTTAEPTTAEPTTAEPTTAEPTTAEPTTAEPTTAEATTEADGQKENFPEEDLSRRLEEEQTKLKNILDGFKKWMKRN